jgi:hypothetical protein
MKTTATAICKAIESFDVAEDRAGQLMTRAVKATNRPELYREVAKVTLSLSDGGIRHDELADEIVELVINLCNDDDMRALLAKFARRDYRIWEDAIAEVAQLVAIVMVGTKVAAKCVGSPAN